MPYHLSHLDFWERTLTSLLTLSVFPQMHFSLCYPRFPSETQNWSYLFPYIKPFISSPFILRINPKISGPQDSPLSSQPYLHFQPHLSPFQPQPWPSSSVKVLVVHTHSCFCIGSCCPPSLEKLICSDWPVPNHSPDWDAALLCSPIYLEHYLHCLSMLFYNYPRFWLPS